MSDTASARLRAWLHWKRIEIETTLAQQPNLKDLCDCQTDFAGDVEWLLNAGDINLEEIARLKAENEQLRPKCTCKTGGATHAGVVHRLGKPCFYYDEEENTTLRELLGRAREHEDMHNDTSFLKEIDAVLGTEGGK